MRRRILATALAFSVALAGLPPSADACTRILWNNNGKVVLVARTMDLYIPDQATILVTPRGVLTRAAGNSTVAPWRTKYGSVRVTAAQVSATDGLNERGLVVNQLYLTGAQYEKTDARPTLANISIVPFLLDNFATVNEAIAGLAKVQVLSVNVLQRDWPTHVAISDASGDSAIVEFIDQQRIVHRGPAYTVMTNEPRIEDQLRNLSKYITFGGTLPIPGGIEPSDRFVRAAYFVRSLKPPKSYGDALIKMFSVINAEAVPFDAESAGNTAASEDKWPTLWTALADSTNGVYYFHPSNSPYSYWINLRKIDLRAGGHPAELSAYEEGLSADISSLFQTR